MTIKANLIIDLGNSQTRLIVQHKTKEGKVLEESRTLKNAFVPLEEDYQSLPEGYDENNTTVLKFRGGEVFGNGLLVEKEFSAIALRPTALQKKAENKTSILSVQMAFLEGQKALGDLLDSDWITLNIEWDVFILLPPSELETGSKALNERISELEEIEFVVPNFKTKLKISSIKIFPEGLGAYIGILMKKGKVIREEYQHLLNSKSLIVDIGAGTTDFFVVEGTQLIDSTKSTIPVGGNNVLSRIKQRLLQEGISLSNKEFENSLITGEVLDGNQVLNISEGIKKSRNLVSQELISKMTDYLESTGYPIRQINYLVVVGGGSIPSSLKNVDNLADYLIKTLKMVAPNIDMLPLPKESGKGINPRLLNIIGAAIMAEN